MSKYHEMMNLIEEVKLKVSDNEYKCLMEKLSELKNEEEKKHSGSKFYKIWYPKLKHNSFMGCIREQLRDILHHKINDSIEEYEGNEEGLIDEICENLQFPSMGCHMEYDSEIIEVEHDNDYRRELERMADNEHQTPVYSHTYGYLYEVKRLN